MGWLRTKLRARKEVRPSRHGRSTAPKSGPFGPNRSADASVMKRPVSPGDQLAGDLAHGIVTEDVDGAVLRLQRPLRGRPQGWLGAP